MTANRSGRANRIAPDGSAHAAAERGLVWGNRGRLLDAHGRVARHSQGRNWLVCVLEYKGRRRVQWRSNRLTELFFLDEATALAAGHRPCGECRYHDYRRFKAAWTRAHPGRPNAAHEIDRALHADRLGPDGHRTHQAELATLPDGVFVEHDARFWLVRGPLLHAWSFAGYTHSVPRRDCPPVVTVRTPRACVATLRAGYLPLCHPSAGG